MNVSHETIDSSVPWQKIKKEIHNQKEDRDRTSKLMKGKAPTHYIVSHCNIGFIEELFNNSFSSWGDS
jgi:hypothetical protein